MHDDDVNSERLTTRSVRSFVIRNGRTTTAQLDAIERLLPRFGIAYQSQTISLSALFGRSAPTWLEIGFGNGDVLINAAEQYDDINIVGVEVHTAGVGHALLNVEQKQLSNVRIVQHDAMEVMQHMLKDASIDKVLLLFPDPWHKKRHHKRRILQQEFLDSVCRVLRPDGTLHCATDWADYAHWMIDYLEADSRFINVAGPGQPSKRPEWRPLTRFEKRGQRLGHSVVDLIYRKK